MVLVHNFLDCFCQSSPIYREETNVSCHAFGIFAWWSEALNVNVMPADSSSAISF